MPDTNAFIKAIRESAGMRIAVLFGAFFLFLILASCIDFCYDWIQFGNERDKLLASSATQAILAFCIPALILGRFSSNNYLNWLYLKNSPQLKSILGVCIVYILSLPMMEWLIDWNQNFHMPESMSVIENALREWETSGELTTEKLLNAKGWFAITLGVMVIGVLTGFAEELFFRGGLQGIFTRTSIGKQTSVWIAAFIFSAMHFQFFGFLPRLLMGAFFGYLLIWTRSLWVPIFAHILNNSIVVIISAFHGSQSETISFYGGNLFGLSRMLPLVSAFLTFLFLLICKDFIFKSNKIIKRPWQKNQLPPVSGK